MGFVLDGGKFGNLKGERMSEKLKDAIFKMKPGDKFETTKSIITRPFTMNAKGSLVNACGDLVNLMVNNLNLEGAIIPAEPKVLSADESFELWDGNSTVSNSRTIGDCYKTGFNYGKQQGRLGMYLEFKKWKEKNDREGNFQQFGFSRALEELKPSTGE
jgi:hypothetical protein